MAASEKEGSSSIASFRARTGFDALTKECAMGREKRPLPHAGLAVRCAEGRVEGRCYADVCAEGAELSLRLTPREREVASRFRLEGAGCRTRPGDLLQHVQDAHEAYLLEVRPMRGRSGEGRGRFGTGEVEGVRM